MIVRNALRVGAPLLSLTLAVAAPAQTAPTFDELKAAGAARSSYLGSHPAQHAAGVPTADLATFRAEIEPILARACYGCHGPKRDKGDLRIDELDPDLFSGADVDWWLDVLAVLNNGEMPPPDAEDVHLDGPERRKVVEWLVGESQRASAVRRGTAVSVATRRLARYEFSYVLQDLLAMSHDFAEDLPPDPVSVDGFENSSDALRLGAVQFRACFDAAHAALELATFTGERPAPLYWSVPMAALAEGEWRRQDARLEQARTKHADDPGAFAAARDKLLRAQRTAPRQCHFRDPATGRHAGQSWGYGGAKHARRPVAEPAAAVPFDASRTVVAVLPPKQKLIVELGDRVPDRGVLRVRVRAARATAEGDAGPSLRLWFGWQASNDSSAFFPIGDRDQQVAAAPGAPCFYEWEVPLHGIYPRNLVRGQQQLGDLPNPSELIQIENASRSSGAVIIDHVEVVAPVFTQWPPASHRAVFPPELDDLEESERARGVLAAFLPRALRRAVGDAEIERKLGLFRRLRADSDSFEAAMLEVLAAVMSSPEFLLTGSLGSSGDGPGDGRLTAEQLATRLSLFLWCSAPDGELRALATDGRLQDPAVLDAQVGRMLADPKVERFVQQFTRQWLNLQLLDYLHVDKKRFPQADAELLAAMAEEPVEFFGELLRRDLSVLEFVHADFAMVNERLSRHYDLPDVVGGEFRRVPLGAGARRGGLLTQAGVLAMNSDGKDSHPLKRGIWLLERLLDDPPPPPPAAVPEIDLADPEIAKMTLKQRLEDHRNKPACLSCHAKIDPWGIVFENFDAVGAFRSEVDGRPVDATAELFNKQRLDGVDGLKRFLLRHRQDQFVRALVKKLTTFALGRPLTFADRAAVDAVTAEARTRGDGLATIVRQIVASELFQSR